MADFINTIDLLGEDVAAGKIIERSITEYNDDALLKVGKYAFCKCENLISIDLPNLTTIENDAFMDCKKLENVNIPNAKTLEARSFAGPTVIKNIRLPKVETMGHFAVISKAMENVYLPATPPALTSSSDKPFGTPGGYNQTPTTCVFHIPAGSLSAYQTANYWSTLTTQCTFLEDA